MPNRVLGNVLIATGALSLAFASSLVRLGLGDYLYVAELAGAGVMFAGVLLGAGRADARGSPPGARRRCLHAAGVGRRRPGQGVPHSRWAPPFCPRGSPGVAPAQPRAAPRAGGAADPPPGAGPGGGRGRIRLRPGTWPSTRRRGRAWARPAAR